MDLLDANLGSHLLLGFFGYGVTIARSGKTMEVLCIHFRAHTL